MLSHSLVESYHSTHSLAQRPESPPVAGQLFGDDKTSGVLSKGKVLHKPPVKPPLVSFLWLKQC